MEAFAVPSNVFLELKGSGTHKQRPPEHVEQRATQARHVGQYAAAVEYDLRVPKDFLVSSDTVCTWLFQWRKEGKVLGSAEGTGPQATVQAQAEWDRQVDGLRSQGEPVTGRVSAIVARAVLSDSVDLVYDWLLSWAHFATSRNFGFRTSLPPVP